MAKPDEEKEEQRMPLWQHLDELRTAIFRSLIVVCTALCVTYYYIEKIIVFLEQPLLKLLPPEDAHLYYTGITEKFMIYIKISVYSAIALVSPYLLFQVWNFVSPALYRDEKKFLIPFLIIGSISFFTGMSFAYYIVIPLGYDFLIKFGSPTDKAMITLSEYFTMTLQMMVGLGLVFELPLVLMLLAKFGIISPSFLGKFRGQAYIGLSLLAAVITPSPDALSMILVLVPLCVLYEISVILVKWVVR